MCGVDVAARQVSDVWPSDGDEERDRETAAKESFSLGAEVDLKTSYGLDGSAASSAQAFMLPLNEEAFKKVELGQVLGQGSFGRVHVGRRRCSRGSNGSPSSSDSKVAIKILEIFDKGDGKMREQLLREAGLMLSMRHPNLVRTFEFAVREKGGLPSSFCPDRELSEPSQCPCILETWLVMEFCNSGTLREAMRNKAFRTSAGGPDLGVILPVALEIAAALVYLHARALVHGDLSPSNVLLSKCKASPTGFTAKVTHMPPEHLETGKLSCAVDVYAFGVILWELYTGNFAWHGLKPTAVICRVTMQKARLQIPEDCPTHLQDLMDRCMAREREDRPTSSQVRAALQAVAVASAGAPLQSSVSPLEATHLPQPHIATCPIN